MKHRTSAYGPTRILLAVGIIATVIVLALGLTLMVREPSMFGVEPTFLGLPSRAVGAALAAAVAVFGLVWMLRIFRGPRVEPPLWRYRER